MTAQAKSAPRVVRSAAAPALVIAIAALAAFQTWPQYHVALALLAVGALILALWVRDAAAVQLTLLVALILAFNASGRLVQWPLPMLAPILAWGAIVFATPPLRRAVRWLRPGRADLLSGFVALGLAGASSIVLLAWAKLAHPDLRAIVAQLPHLSPPLLLLGGLVFALGNALMEELVWRGAMQTALGAVFGAPWLALVLQAASFGVAHIHGFPSGGLGMALAGAWGLVIGYLRLRTNGLLIPVLTHVVADATVFAILVLVLR